MIRRGIYAWELNVSSVVLALVVVASAVSCDPGVTYYIENRTDAAVDAYTGERHFARLQPGTDIAFDSVNPGLFWPERIHAYAEDGSLIFDRTFTRDEVEELDNRIVIE